MESFARLAAQALDKDTSLGDGAQSYAVLAKGLAVEDKIDEGRNAAARAQSLSQKSGDFLARFDATLAPAAAESQAGELDRAVKSLQLMHTESKAHGFLGYELEARLNLGQVKVKSGRTSTARLTLEQVQEDATKNGFLLIFRKAGNALNDLRASK